MSLLQCIHVIPHKVVTSTRTPVDSILGSSDHLAVFSMNKYNSDAKNIHIIRQFFLLITLYRMYEILFVWSAYINVTAHWETKFCRCLVEHYRA